MEKHFGTDGIRGIVGQDFTPNYIFDIASAVTFVCQPKRVVIGWDTRASCDFIVNVFAGVLAGLGVKVLKVGIVPTAALSFLTNKLSADIGVMVTASHNDYTYNGIKLFASSGEKMNDQTTQKINKLIGMRCDCKRITADKVGKITDNNRAIKYWHRFLIKQFSINKEFRIAIDCAYGSGFGCAQDVMKGLGVNATLFNTEHNGININHDCGATKPAYLRYKMLNGNYDVGFAFDGDADRCVVFDEHGNAIHGDVLIYILAKHLKADKIATTILFNLGVQKELEKQGIQIIKTDVGDRHIYAAIKQYELKLGGETSGHIIMPDRWCSGDGLMVALVVLSIMKQSGKKLSELVHGIKLYPQINRNIPATQVQKQKIKPYIKMRQCGCATYKIIVRPSGTENLIRITVEGNNLAECELLANQIILEIKAQL